MAIPEGVTSIGDHAFVSCTNLTNITIPDGVTTFGNWAFSYCHNLSSITIPDSVISIGEWLLDEYSDTYHFVVGHNSYAEQYCIENGFDYSYSVVEE